MTVIAVIDKHIPARRRRARLMATNAAGHCRYSPYCRCDARGRPFARQILRHVDVAQNARLDAAYLPFRRAHHLPGHERRIGRVAATLARAR